MNAFQRFIRERMDERGWTAADLARASGVTKQTLSGILNDPRARLDRMPTERTTNGLARAFDVEHDVVLLAVGRAMGVPVDEPVAVVDVRQVATRDLLRELARRLGEPHGHE